MAGTTITDLENEWDVDCKIDRTEPSIELEKLPKVRAKYLRYWNNHCLKLISLDKKFKELEQFKTDYYSGDLNNPEDLAKYNIAPYPKATSNKFEIAKLVTRDPEMVDLQTKIAVQKHIVKLCENILGDLKDRNYALRAIVDYEKFARGT